MLQTTIDGICTAYVFVGLFESIPMEHTTLIDFRCKFGSTRAILESRLTLLSYFTSRGVILMKGETRHRTPYFVNDAKKSQLDGTSHKTSLTSPCRCFPLVSIFLTGSPFERYSWPYAGQMQPDFLPWCGWVSANTHRRSPCIGRARWQAGGSL